MTNAIDRAASVLMGATMMTLAWLAAADAAGFDCQQARTPRERAICGDPSLSLADDRLASSYRSDVARVSPEAALVIRNDQRAWLKDLDALCTPGTSADPFRACLLRAYGERQRALDDLVQQHGPFTFFIVHRSLVKRMSDDTLVSTAEYPQIDRPQSPAQRAWNRSVERSPDKASSCDDGAGEMDEARSVRFATSMIISTSLDTYFYCTGTPHGTGMRVSSADMLTPSLHKLTPEELFKSGAPWKAFVGAAVAAGVRAAAESGGYSPPEIPKPTDDFGTDMSKWALGTDGVTVEFDPYELNMGRNFEPRVLVTWRELAPFLKTGIGLPPP